MSHTMNSSGMLSDPPEPFTELLLEACAIHLGECGTVAHLVSVSRRWRDIVSIWSSTNVTSLQLGGRSEARKPRVIDMLLRAACAACPAIYKLDVAGCKLLSAEAARTVAHLCPRLEVLKLRQARLGGGVVHLATAATVQL